MKKIIFGVSLVVLLLGGFFTFQYLGLDKQPLPYGGGITTSSSTESVGYRVEEVVSGLEVPWSIVWTSPERILVAERPGRIRIVENGKLLEKPLISFEDTINKGETGLMGLTADPEYSKNKFLYACYAIEGEDGLVGQVVRLTDDGSSATINKTLLENIPSAQYHAGCRVAFGPDGKLYITTGDATDRNLAQNTSSLAGKILRINNDGSIPENNPFPSSPIWSFGHRNPQGIAWHPITKELYETEHGPSLFDGPAGGDEVNRIVRGGNYGWPLVSHENRRTGTEAPLLIFTPAEAPASAAFYSSDQIPQFKNNFFFGALRGEGIIRVVFDGINPNKVIVQEKLPEVKLGRIRAIAEGPDGYLYFSTSNRDGRGNPDRKDDRIFRLLPNPQ